MTDISCIVNCHRESSLVHPTLRSVERAKRLAEECGLDVEVIVALDDSDDDTRGVVGLHVESGWRTTDYRFSDLALSRNAAVGEAEGKYVAFVDGDDLWCESWLVDSYMLAERRHDDVILHPEFNVYFGAVPHVLQHVDMESCSFDREFLFKRNYWTALSFAARSVYERFPYRKNTILDGFGYEDWTWNFETITDGLIHKVTPGAAHFIRRGKAEQSLLDRTNSHQAIPRIFELYRTRTAAAE